MSERPFVSIVIPTYNVEKYISKTLNSLKIQSYKNFEVIIVDDGSSDNTKKVVMKELKETKLFWKIIEEKHSGVSTARNAGIRMARGKYIYFLDGDDYIDSNLIKTLYLKINKYKNLDIIFFGYDTVLPTGKKIKRYVPDDTHIPINGKKVLKNFLSGNIHLLGGNMFFNREFLLAHNIFFSPELRNLEDVEFIFKACYNARKVYSINKVLFFYVKRQKSASDLYSEGQIIKVIKYTLNAYQNMVQYLKNKKCKDLRLYKLIDDFIGRTLRWEIGELFTYGGYDIALTKRNDPIILYLIEKSSSKNLRELLQKSIILYVPWMYKFLRITFKKLKYNI